MGGKKKLYNNLVLFRIKLVKKAIMLPCQNKCARRKVNNKNLSISRSSAWCCLVRCFSWSTDEPKKNLFKKTKYIFTSASFHLSEMKESGPRKHLRFQFQCLLNVFACCVFVCQYFVRVCRLFFLRCAYEWFFLSLL